MNGKIKSLWAINGNIYNITSKDPHLQSISVLRQRYLNYVLREIPQNCN